MLLEMLAKDYMPNIEILSHNEENDNFLLEGPPLKLQICSCIN